MDEAGRAGLGRYGQQLAAEHPTAAGITVPPCRWLADHRSVGTADLDVAGILRQRAEAPRLGHLQGVS